MLIRAARTAGGAGEAGGRYGRVGGARGGVGTFCRGFHVFANVPGSFIDSSISPIWSSPGTRCFLSFAEAVKSTAGPERAGCGVGEKISLNSSSFAYIGPPLVGPRALRCQRCRGAEAPSARFDAPGWHACMTIGRYE